MSDMSDRMRAHFSGAMKADPTVELLVIEACRVAERLDELDKIISGKTDFLELMHFRLGLHDEDVVTVKMDNALAEARQQANTLRGLIGQLEHVEVVVSPEARETSLDRLLREREMRLSVVK